MDNDPVKTVLRNKVSRRQFLAGAGAGAGTAAAAAIIGCGDGRSSLNSSSGSSSSSSGGSSGSSGSNPGTPSTASSGATDTDIFNFALNLEYLEAEYYLRATTGSGIPSADIGSKPGMVTGGTLVRFNSPAIAAYAAEIAADELAHVRFLRNTLDAVAVDEPTIDLVFSFNALAMAAGIGSSFNPFADQNSFLVGAFVFEDLGVTAYHGVASLLSSTTNLGYTAGIYGTEAYHAGEIRTLIAQLGNPYLTFANQISAFRAAAGGGNETTLSGSTIVAADSNSIAFDRTTSLVLHIVYLSAAPGVVSKGGFFPNGLNGTISASTS